MGRMMKLGLGRCGVGLVLGWGLVACGGGLDPTPVASDSYSPHAATTATGEAAQTVWWKYQVNGGEPVTFADGGYPVSIDFDDVTVVLDPVANERRIDLHGQVSADVAGTRVGGSYSTKVVQRIEGGDTTRVVEETQQVETVMTAQGDTVRSKAEMVQTPTMPWEWLPDRADLDQIPVGEPQTLSQSAELSGELTLYVTGYDSQSESIEQSVTLTDTWTVMSTQGSVTVQGEIYENVVVLQRTTMSPNPQTGAIQQQTMSLEVARGIGIVRSTGWFSIGTTPLTMELVDTNLVLTFD